MTREDQITKKDRMRYTKDKLSSTLVIGAIVFDALYFVSIYNSDAGNYYYTWQTGASIVYNLLFMLIAFLASEGVKNRKSGYTLTLLVLGAMQVVRMFYLPAQAHAATVTIQEVESVVMGDAQYAYVLACLAVSAVCCVAGAITSYINNKTLAGYLHSLEKTA